MQTIVSYSDDIDKAIVAHGQWKQRLLSAITKGTSEFSVAQVQVDNRCDFGKWFYGLPDAVRETEHGKTVQRLHASFHAEAARILELALQGRIAEAEKSMEPGLPYARLTGQLVIALTNWKQIIGKS